LSHYPLSHLDNQFLETQIQRWDPNVPITKSHTPPSSWYNDPRFLLLEKKKVFTQNWICAGREDQLSSPGSYFCGNILDEPFIVTRDQNNQINAFFNVCRHHGSVLCEGSGTQEAIVCPYHGWTYGLDGRLHKATEISGIKDFKPKDYGLNRIPVSKLGPWLFIYLGNQTPAWTLSELDLLQQRLDKTNYQNLKLLKTSTYLVESNWKVYVDNYCDGGYHVRYLHKSLNQQINYDKYKTEVFPRFSIQSVPGTLEGEDFFRNRIGSEGALYIYLYPNLMINRYGDWMDTNWIIPLDHKRTLVHFDYYYKENLSQENKEIIEKSIQESDKIQQEDEMISKRVQQGLLSSGYDVGRYAPQVETAAYHFHQLLYKEYTK